MALVQGGFDCIKISITLVIIKNMVLFHADEYVTLYVNGWLQQAHYAARASLSYGRSGPRTRLLSNFHTGGSRSYASFVASEQKNLASRNPAANDKFDSYWLTVRVALAAVRNSARDCRRRQGRQFANDLVIPVKEHIVYHYLVHIYNIVVQAQPFSS